MMLLVQIGENGRPGRVTVKQSSGYAVLDRAAQGTVSGWTFLPAQRDGMPIRSLAEVPIIFSLRDAR
jgi:protein TonB